MKVRALLLVGPSGSGKTPLGALLERRGLGGRPCRHFDLGAELRRLAALPGPPPGFTAADVETVRRSLRTGALFEDAELHIPVRIFDRFAALSGRTGRTLVVLNGFPRHENQARALEDRVAVELVVSLEASAGDILERVRRDSDGDRAGRPDDSPGEIGKRIAVYGERTAPLVRFYGSRGARTVTIEVTARSTAEEHLAALLAAMTGP